MKARIACALLLIGSLAALACGGENSLGGSVDALFPLQVSFVQIRRNPEAFQVGYYNNRGHDIDLVAQFTVALNGIELRPGQHIDLSGEYDAGHPRAVVVHAAADEAPRVLPVIKQGDLVVSQGGNPDELTVGDWSVGFVQGSDYGAGRTIFGNFTGVALDAGFEPDDGGRVDAGADGGDGGDGGTPPPGSGCSTAGGMAPATVASLLVAAALLARRRP